MYILVLDYLKMLKNASEWKLVVNEYRTSREASLPAIEPGINFTSNIIGTFVTSSLAPSSWYTAGDFLQLYQTGFGAVGHAQAKSFKIILNRYQIHRFDNFSFNESKYLISFVPKFYLQDINLKVWEYVGHAGATLESLESNVKAVHQRLISESVSVKLLLKRIEENHKF